MRERTLIRLSILIYWTLFWGLSVIDKMIPAVQLNWVGKDFFTLFVKLFESLGIKDPFFATVALIIISSIEAIIFVFYLFSIINFAQRNIIAAEKWFSRAIFTSVVLFTLFSIGDNAFGDRFQLLEHGLLWMILIASWAVFKHIVAFHEESLIYKSAKSMKALLLIGFALSILTSISIIQFSNKTYANKQNPVSGKEVAAGVYKFDLPFLADREVMQKTVNQFKQQHQELEVSYIYTGPSELNSKKRTHVLLYLFTEKKVK